MSTCAKTAATADAPNTNAPLAISKAPCSRPARYAQVEKLLAERNSQRSIVRATGVSRMTVAKLAKKSGASVPSPAAPAAEKRPTQALGSA